MLWPTTTPASDTMPVPIMITDTYWKVPARLTWTPSSTPAVDRTTAESVTSTP